jgi:hypothetical protein
MGTGKGTTRHPVTLAAEHRAHTRSSRSGASALAQREAHAAASLLSRSDGKMPSLGRDRAAADARRWRRRGGQCTELGEGARAANDRLPVVGSRDRSAWRCGLGCTEGTSVTDHEGHCRGRPALPAQCATYLERLSEYSAMEPCRGHSELSLFTVWAGHTCGSEGSLPGCSAAPVAPETLGHLKSGVPLL